MGIKIGGLVTKFNSSDTLILLSLNLIIQIFYIYLINTVIVPYIGIIWEMITIAFGKSRKQFPKKITHLLPIELFKLVPSGSTGITRNTNN